MAYHLKGGGGGGGGDDDDFAEYNPHPYKGGYDIALTYGNPLPPSPSTCYPISSHSTPPPLPPTLPLPPPPDSDHRSPLPPESDHRPEPYYPLPLLPPPESDHRPIYDYGGLGYCPVECSTGSDLFGFWSFLTAADDERRGCEADAFVEEVGYWNQWKRAGDYLFGYSDGYGERRIGVDSYGIPIYANKKEATEPLTFEIEPPRDQRLDYYESDPWFMSEIGKKDESYGYAYNKHNYQEAFHVQEILSEPVLHQRLTYHEVCDEKGTSYGDECNSYGNGQSSYEGDYEESPICFQLEPYRSTWSQNPSYSGSHWEAASLQSNWQTSYSCVDESNFYGSVQYSYGRHYSEQPLCVELEPYKPSSYQNLCYHDSYGGATPFELNSLSSEDKGMWDESNTFRYYDSGYQIEYHRQPACEQLVPFKSAWSQNPTQHEPYIQDTSHCSRVDDDFKEYSPQYLSPFLKFLEYDEYHSTSI